MMSEDNRAREQRRLLQGLRSTVEGLLGHGVSNVWNVYGGLNRLHGVVEQIFKHGCRIFDPSGEPDCWVFIQGLNWLQPSLAVSPAVSQGDEFLANLPSRISGRNDILWMYKSLETHTLSQKLSWLLSDKEHLLSCLEPWAFLRQESLAEATLICLRAVERNQAALLTEIDPCLFLPGGGRSSRNSPRRHRRSSSYPTNFGVARSDEEKAREIGGLEYGASFVSRENARVREAKNEEEERTRRKNNKNEEDDDDEKAPKCSTEERDNETSLKSWTSMPVLCKDHEVCQSRALPLASSFATTTTTTSEIGTAITSFGRTSGKIRLADVIKIDYSEARIASTCGTRKKNGYGKSKKNVTRKQRLPVKCRDGGSNDVATSNNEKNGGSTIEGSVDERATIDRRRSYEDRRVEARVSDERIRRVETTEKTRKRSLFASGSAPEFTGSWSSGVEGQKDSSRTPRKSFMEDGGSSIQPMATGYFPRPREGQTLTSFLSSAQFSRANAELDRENAHFSISEAMIAAIEQVKCNRQLRLIDETVDESDEEINNLKQRIRMRRRQRQIEQRKFGNWSRDLLSDGKTDTTTTDQSVSPLSSLPSTPSDGISTDGVDDLEMEDSRNLSQMRSSGVSMSMASLYSDADLYRSSPRRGNEAALTDSMISAEGVALCLISRFNERHLPRASELRWLVSEQDAPQRLLPMPKNWSANSDDGKSDETSGQAVPLRGTIEWAPPRPQIIFTPHPPPAKRILIAKQNYRCAGCGMKVAVEYANRFRYCEYLGRYFCTGCHTNQVAPIPGKILSKWDFNRYPVSNFSYRLLDQMAGDPLFRVKDLNPLLYRRVKQLERTRLLRTQLYYLKDFLMTCRFALSIQESLKTQPSYVLNDPHVYSMQDLMAVKVGTLTVKLNELVQQCCAHVHECVLCEARGFVCELCCTEGNTKVIFPWELSRVTRCNVCGSCFHAKCRNASNSTLECPRCVRLRKRRAFKD